MSRSRLIQQLHKYAGAPAPQDDARERGIGVPATIAAGGALLAGNPMARLHETLDGFDFNKRRDELLTPHKGVMEAAHAAQGFTPTASTTEAEMRTFLSKLTPAEATAYANAENNVARVNSVAGQRWSSPLRFAAGAALAGYGAKKIYDNINHNSELRERQAGGNVKAASATPANPAIRSGLDYLKYVAPGALAGGAIGAMTGEDGDGRGWQGAALGAAAGLGVRQLAAARQFHNLSKEQELLRTQATNYKLEGIPTEKEIQQIQRQYPNELFQQAAVLGEPSRLQPVHAVGYSAVPKNSTIAAGEGALEIHPRRADPIRINYDLAETEARAQVIDHVPLPMGDVMQTERLPMTDELRNTLTSERNRRALIGGVGTTAALGAGAYTLGRKNKTESQSGENMKAASFTSWVFPKSRFG